MRLALGPLAYYWPRQAVLDFYVDVAGTPVDIVYIGETICSRRKEIRWADWLEIGEMLAAAGKEVVLSSLALIETEADLRLLRRMAEQDRFRVEANDMGAVNLLARRASGLAFVAGASLNVFNGRSLAALHRAGASRWVATAELSQAMLAKLLAERPAGMETEMLVHGRLPLAYSARCFTARHYELQKDQCDYRCLAHPDGLALRTREGQPFLTINGVQTQSARTYTLLVELPAIAAMGIDVVRLSPTVDGTLAVIEHFRAAIDGALDAADAYARLRQLMSDASCNGYWYGRPGADQVAPSDAAANRC